MRITANQVTFVRLLLLPVPVAMVYQDQLSWKLWALAVYVALGLTDALDGILARRYGSTPLGALLDPIVDKIFLVAGFLPLADFGVVPISFVSLIFVRELGVTALRSVAFEENTALRTSRIAKLKTTVQMAGAGFLLLVWLFPGEAAIRWILGAFAAASLAPIAVSLARGLVPGWRAIWGGILIVFVAAMRFLLDRDSTLLGLALIILIFTLLSGVEYAWGIRKALAARFRRSPIEALRLPALSLAIPALLLPRVTEAPFLILGLTMALVAAELAVGGLDNSLAHAGVRRGPWSDLLRSAAQAAAGCVLLISLPGDGGMGAVTIALSIALLVTLADLGRRFTGNSRVFRTPSDTPRGVEL